MGFQKQWVNQLTGRPKLSEVEFITFRWPRRDRDWEVGEIVQVVIRPRTKERIPLGEAAIISKEPRSLNSKPNLLIIDSEAMMDGFPNADALREFLRHTYKALLVVHRLTLQWKVRYPTCPRIEMQNVK